MKTSLSQTPPELAAAWHPPKNGNLNAVSVALGEKRTLIRGPGGEGRGYGARLMDRNSSGGNPHNDRPTVRLLDQSGAGLGQVSQREAARLLRRGQAELVLGVPPAVRLSIPRSEYETPSAGPAQFLHARQGALYGNVSFESP